MRLKVRSAVDLPHPDGPIIAGDLVFCDLHVEIDDGLKRFVEKIHGSGFDRVGRIRVLCFVHRINLSFPSGIYF